MLLLVFGGFTLLASAVAAAIILYFIRLALATALLCLRILWLVLNMPPAHFFAVVGVLWVVWAIGWAR